MNKIDLIGATKGLTNKEIRGVVNSTTTSFLGGVSKMLETESQMDEALSEYKGYGFRLMAGSNHTLELYHGGKRIAVYNQDKVTASVIREGCKNYLANINRE